MIHSSGDQRADETHAIFPIHNKARPDATYSEADARYVEQLDRAMKRGTGIVVLHYSLIVENPRSRSYLLDWIGGYHRSGQSQVKVDRSEATPAKTAATRSSAESGRGRPITSTTSISISPKTISAVCPF